jgi:TolB-like protein
VAQSGQSAFSRVAGRTSSSNRLDRLEIEFIRHPVAKGIAVLPFENLNGDPDNAYFADGIKDEILTKLSNVHDLKVISRTSTAKYRQTGQFKERRAGTGCFHNLKEPCKRLATKSATCS